MTSEIIWARVLREGASREKKHVLAAEAIFCSTKPDGHENNTYKKRRTIIKNLLHSTTGDISSVHILCTMQTRDHN